MARAFPGGEMPVSLNSQVAAAITGDFTTGFLPNSPKNTPIRNICQGGFISDPPLDRAATHPDPRQEPLHEDGSSSLCRSLEIPEVDSYPCFESHSMRVSR